MEEEQYITDLDGKQYKSLVGIHTKNYTGDAPISIVKKVQEIGGGDYFFMKYCLKDSNAMKYLQRESGFRLHYPYIERMVKQFEGKDPEGRQIYGVLMEHISGSTLAEYIKKQLERKGQKIISEEKYEQEMFRQMTQLIYSIHYYSTIREHDSFLHRDLKPDNIMITEEGNVVLVDFDNAHAPGSSGTILTGEDKNLAGTPGYMDPDVVNEKVEPDIQSDIYSLGRVFFFWLNGQHYYKDTELENLDYCKDENLAFGMEENRFCQTKYLGERYVKLIQMIRRMCAKREDRFRSVFEIKKEMEAFLIEFYGNSVASYVTNMRINEMPLLKKRMDRGIEHAQNVACQISPKKLGWRGKRLYNYTMRDILLEGQLVMTIYNINSSIYYIPYAADLVRKSERDDYEIHSGDAFIIGQQEIRFRIS